MVADVLRISETHVLGTTAMVSITHDKKDVVDGYLHKKVCEKEDYLNEDHKITFTVLVLALVEVEHFSDN